MPADQEFPASRADGLTHAGQRYDMRLWRLFRSLAILPCHNGMFNNANAWDEGWLCGGAVSVELLVRHLLHFLYIKRAAEKICNAGAVGCRRGKHFPVIDVQHFDMRLARQPELDGRQMLPELLLHLGVADGGILFAVDEHLLL